MAQAKYVPIGNTIDLSVAFIQAASALDVAAKIATENRDQETMLNIALGWLELGRRLGYASEEEESEEKEKNKDFGFSLNSQTEIVEELEEELEEEPEDED
jgi:hypothetical protein